MTTPNPITPPPELVEQWMQAHSTKYELAREAAQWGADQELVACGNYLKQCAAWEEEDVIEFYNYRRPKPPSLKEQALKIMSQPEWSTEEENIIRRALEALND